ncbi:ABC transporter ATP-binding protein [Rubripirellula lacrimiformis]|uniref:ABC transporter ATP-binding protein n=1 Tax=Rubripirellula lacrimiformis TaxID=1930273 RepID=UPI001FE48475|nr:ABC transporter ATP-binding protein [Rubripirellula lacrimiformis]
MNSPALASAIRCDSLSIQYAGGVRAVDSVSLTADASKVLALVGPSGCGKTTLLRLMAGLEKPTQGSVSMDPVAAGSRGEVAFVFQQPTLLPWRTACQNVMLPLELIGHGNRRDQREVAMEMLARVGLEDASKRFPHQLSGGMKMRVSIARALVTRPRVLLLDEPFAALDDMLRNQLGELVMRLWDDHRFTAVMVTHNIAEAIGLSHQVAVMRSGRVTSVLDNPLSFPRSESLRSTPEFGRFYGIVSAELRGVS